MNVLKNIRFVCLGLAFIAPVIFAAGPSSPAPTTEHPPTSVKSSSAASKVASAKAGTAKSAAKTSPKAKKSPANKVARKGKARKESDVLATPVPPAKLDLTLPKAMVDKLEPPAKEAQKLSAGKPILPQMFAEKKPDTDDFQLNGRILNNEMGLPMIRNEGRREIEGAALDFKFKQ
jgi:hypothetical protein